MEPFEVEASLRGIIAARMERVAACQSAQALQYAAYRSVFEYRLDHVLATRGIEPAAVAEQRAKQQLVEPNCGDDRRADRPRPTACLASPS